MHKIVSLFALTLAAASFAYQVTGPVTEVTDSKIVVTKGKEKFDIARDASTKMETPVKVGDKVTVEYSMTAKTIEAKADKTKKK